MPHMQRHRRHFEQRQSASDRTTLLAAAVEAGLKERCAVGLRSIPVLDSSFLLQCQLSDLPLPQPSSPRALDAVVVMTSFGSLLWGQGGLTGIDVPVLSIGGSLDLITPPLTEQLRPFAQFSDRRSRFALVEGGSHFSPVGISRDEALMQLSSDLVGRNPADVQQALLQLQLPSWRWRWPLPLP